MKTSFAIDRLFSLLHDCLVYGHPKGARHWYTMVLSLLTPAGFIKDGTCTFNSLLRRSWLLLSSSEGVVGAGRRFVLHLPAFCLQVVHYYSQKAQGISLPLSFKVALDSVTTGTTEEQVSSVPCTSLQPEQKTSVWAQPLRGSLVWDTLCTEKSGLDIVQDIQLNI